MSGTLVIGGAGFVGGNLIPKLLETGRKVRAIDIVPPEAATRLKGYSVDYRWKSTLDIEASDLDDMTDVVYLAAQADVPLAIKSPRFTTQQNISAIVNYLDVVSKLQNPPRTIYMSSESVYGVIPIEQQPITEESPMNPSNAYAASKAAAEIFVNAFARQFNLPILVLRSTTLYGPASRAKQVVPIFIRQALENKPITVEGDGSSSRDFNYIKNMLNGIMRAVNNNVPPGIYNIGSGVELSIKELAENIIRISGSKSEISYGPWRPGEQGVKLNVSIEKAKKYLGYEPTYSVEQGLTETIKWWRQH